MYLSQSCRIFIRQKELSLLPKAYQDEYLHSHDIQACLFFNFASEECYELTFHDISIGSRWRCMLIEDQLAHDYMASTDSPLYCYRTHKSGLASYTTLRLTNSSTVLDLCQYILQ